MIQDVVGVDEQSIAADRHHRGVGSLECSYSYPYSWVAVVVGTVALRRDVAKVEVVGVEAARVRDTLAALGEVGE